MVQYCISQRVLLLFKGTVQEVRSQRGDISRGAMQGLDTRSTMKVSEGLLLYCFSSLSNAGRKVEKMGKKKS